MGTFLDPIIYLFGREGGEAGEEGAGVGHKCHFLLGFSLADRPSSLRYSCRLQLGALEWWHSGGQLWGPGFSHGMVTGQQEMCTWR